MNMSCYTFCHGPGIHYVFVLLAFCPGTHFIRLNIPGFVRVQIIPKYRRLDNTLKDSNWVYCGQAEFKLASSIGI